MMLNMRPVEDFAAALVAADDLPAITRIVRSAAREVTGAHGATFVLRENDSCFYADEDAIAPLWKGQRLPMVPVGTPAAAAIGAYWSHTGTPPADRVANFEHLAHLTADAVARVGLDDAPWAPNFSHDPL